MKKLLVTLSITGLIIASIPMHSSIAMAPIDNTYLNAVVSLNVVHEAGIQAEKLDDSGETFIITEQQELEQYFVDREEYLGTPPPEGLFELLLPYLEEQTALGSGTVFTSDHLILTNAHVVISDGSGKPSTDITISYTLDSKLPPVCMAKGKVLAYDIPRDLAIVEPTKHVDENCGATEDFTSLGQYAYYIPFRTAGFYSTEIPEIGEALTVLGYPAIGSTSITINSGVVSGYLYDDTDPTKITAIKTDADIDGGNSGGAVLDDNGDFVGVPSFGAFDVEEGAKLNGLIPLNTINEWFKELETKGVLEYTEAVVDLECFPDVKKSHPNALAICTLKSYDIIKGYPDGKFKPFNTVNRAELLKILVEALNLRPSVDNYNSCFPDVLREWYAPYVCYAKEQGYVDGYPDGTFKPGDTVNKVEALKMILKSKNFTGPETLTTSPFNDVTSDDWFHPYVLRAKELNLLTEIGDHYRPDTGMSRANISEIIYRILVLLQETRS